MTAEIAILNKAAVALAADSAVTIGNSNRSKIYNSVGIMIYGSAELMSVPWETVIKIYRNDLGDKYFAKLSDYVDDFVRFLARPNALFPAEAKAQFLNRGVRGYFHMMREEIDKRVQDRFKTGQIAVNDLKILVRDVVKAHLQEWSKSDFLKHVKKSGYESIKRRFRTTFERLRRQVFQKLPMATATRAELVEIAASIFCRDRFPNTMSGVVIAGFGESEEFPAVISLAVDGMIDGVFKYKVVRSEAITVQSTASVMPFAQFEMVHTFIEGVDPEYGASVDAYIEKILQEYPSLIVDHIGNLPAPKKEHIVEALQKVGKTLSSEFSTKLRNFRRQHHIDPILDAVAVLPKDELAAMAESLVNLTSFKRRISMEAETVGGPIDVVVISKCDGLVWIKRKHYFKPELNPGFFANYYRNSGR